MRIIIEMKDGTKKEFPDERRPGGSYRNQIRNEPNFIVVTDVWGKETWIPTDQVASIKAERGR